MPAPPRSRNWATSAYVTTTNRIISRLLGEGDFYWNWLFVCKVKKCAYYTSSIQCTIAVILTLCFLQDYTKGHNVMSQVSECLESKKCIYMTDRNTCLRYHLKRYRVKETVWHNVFGGLRYIRVQECTLKRIILISNDRIFESILMDFSFKYFNLLKQAPRILSPFRIGYTNELMKRKNTACTELLS